MKKKTIDPEDMTSVRVAQKIQISLGKPIQSSDPKMRALHELLCYLQCFLETHAFTENKPRVHKVIKKMMLNANLKNNILSFSFPAKLRRQFKLHKRYSMALTHDDIFTFFLRDLKPKFKFSANIIVITSFLFTNKN